MGEVASRRPYGIKKYKAAAVLGGLAYLAPGSLHQRSKLGEPSDGSLVAQEGITAFERHLCTEGIRCETRRDAATLRDPLKEQLDALMDRLLEPKGIVVHQRDTGLG